MRRLFASILYIIAVYPAHAQKGAVALSLEPNLMFAGRTYHAVEDKPLYLKNTNAPGIGVNAGYQLNWRRLFTIAQFNFIVLRNGVTIDFPASGLNTVSEISYDKEKYVFDYVTALGVTLSGGVRLPVSAKSVLYAGAGLHLHYSFINTDNNGVQINFSNSGNGDFRFMYTEDVDDLPRINIGGDVFVNYAFRIGRPEVFAGLHYSTNPGQQVRGSFRSFNGLAAQNLGTFELKTSYIGLNIGVILPHK